MLVLSRKEAQRIKISDDITITVVEIRGDKVRLGIDAPGGVPVHREEVWVQIQESNNQGDDHDRNSNEHEDDASGGDDATEEAVRVAGVDHAWRVAGDGQRRDVVHSR